MTDDHTETEGLGQWTGIVEPGEGLVLALDGVKELRVVVDVFEGILVSAIQDGPGIESRHFAMGEHHATGLADVKRAL